MADIINLNDKKEKLIKKKEFEKSFPEIYEDDVEERLEEIDEGLIETLEAMLIMAKKGDIKDIFIIYYDDETSLPKFALSFAKEFRMSILGGLELAKDFIKSKCIINERDNV